MTLDRQVERARRHMEEHRAKHGDPMLDWRKGIVTDEYGNIVHVYTYPETLPWWRRFIAWWRGQ